MKYPRPFIVLKSGVSLFTIYAYSNKQARRLAAQRIVGTFMVLAVRKPRRA
jgi:hypothetical protein